MADSDSIKLCECGCGERVLTLGSRFRRGHHNKLKPPRQPCTMEGCDKPSRGRGLCATHWSRWRRYGDPNYVKQHADYVLTGDANPHYRHGLEKHPLYQIWNAMMHRCYDQKAR